MIRPLALSLLAAGLWCADPVRLDLQAFEQPLSVSGWRTYAWSRPLDDIRVATAELDGGKVLRIDAVDAGAAGLVSRTYPVTAADSGWRVTLRLKADAGYAGNQPWFFAAVNDEAGKFLPPAVDLAPAAKAGAEWKEVTLEVAHAKLPAGASKVTFNFASAALKGQTPAGALLIDDVRVEALR